MPVCSRTGLCFPSVCCLPPCYVFGRLSKPGPQVVVYAENIAVEISTTSDRSTTTVYLNFRACVVPKTNAFTCLVENTPAPRVEVRPPRRSSHATSPLCVLRFLLYATAQLSDPVHVKPEPDPRGGGVGRSQHRRLRRGGKRMFHFVCLHRCHPRDERARVSRDLLPLVRGGETHKLL